MEGASSRSAGIDWLAAWPMVLGLGFALRVAAAVVVQWIVDRRGVLCVFPDSYAYWELSRTIVAGEPYRAVSEWGQPHYALRTPGYPIFLAACRGVFGLNNRLAIRLVQAAIGTGSAWLVGRLVAHVRPEEATRPGWSVPKVAALLAAVDPFYVVLSILILSESVFVPWMLSTLWGVASLWPAREGRDRGATASHHARRPLTRALPHPGGEDSPRRWPLVAFGTGLAAGAAVLSRPSWWPFVPVLIVVWVLAAGRGRRSAALRRGLVVVMGGLVVMTPWWARNARVYGRFVPTALWVGPSLYDGLNPNATGASDMSFLEQPSIRDLDEETMETTLRARALTFAREHPGRALRLAAIKSARFWSPWPNAEEVRQPGLALVGALITIPIYILMLIGAWDRRRDPRALILLAGSLLYFWILHSIFVGSVRYRVPGALPAFGLAAIGWRRLVASRETLD